MTFLLFYAYNLNCTTVSNNVLSSLLCLRNMTS